MDKQAPKHGSYLEFVVIMALLFSAIAFAIDAMLPALPLMADTLTPEAPNRIQWVISSFLLGIGLGTIVTGPLSDAVGRRPVILGGLVVYALAAVLAALSQSLEAMLAARVLQGLGASGPRVAVMALVRDRFSGRDMARTSSFIMSFFTLVPAIAPTLGAGLMAAFGWRAIFVAFVIFALIAGVWFMARQPETLRPEMRRSLHPGPILVALREVLTNRQALLTTLAQALAFALLYIILASSAQVFTTTFDAADTFPFWFGVMALLSAFSTLLNAVLVGRLGMRNIVSVVFAIQLVLSLVTLLMNGPLSWPEGLAFPAWIFWQTSIFFTAGMTIGNLNALAMEPLGHIAGTAASAIGAFSTIVGVLLSVPVAAAYDGTPFWLAFGAVLVVGSGLALIRAS
ncbi:multidrug MFS transporter [Loktanella sp. 22II-4b]|nr:multidrug MFS transporter [Loktanella sp. 22II-4b]